MTPGPADEGDIYLRDRGGISVVLTSLLKENGDLILNDSR
jgi:hypothetical protein